MVYNKVDIGKQPGDGTGDAVRDAFDKINANIDDLAAAVMSRLEQQATFAALRRGDPDGVVRHLEDGPPKRAPNTYGALWIDVTTNKIYLSTGTSSPSDWREIAFVSSGEPT